MAVSTTFFTAWRTSDPTFSSSGCAARKLTDFAVCSAKKRATLSEILPAGMRADPSQSEGEDVVFGSLDEGKFGVLWLSEGRVTGSFLEGGTAEQFKIVHALVEDRAAANDALLALEGEGGAGFDCAAIRAKMQADSGARGGGGGNSGGGAP